MFEEYSYCEEEGYGVGVRERLMLCIMTWMNCAGDGGPGVVDRVCSDDHAGS